MRWFPYERHHVDGDGIVLVPTEAAAEPLPVLDPARHREVGGLGDVEPVVEPAVVGVREHNDHIPLLLHNLVHLRSKPELMVGKGKS